ncbi:hypothetical protein BCR42DRAFT_403321 [Absidia repens]|uniref:RING-type domain-containing protein n=1 Tax=Absidia repens TaxID=90262 RepID=A0A1X2IZ95_9FUNG|nr:hypothetical protein BCR42DRAFT_403321 [Absidia repens]
MEEQALHDTTSMAGSSSSNSRVTQTPVLPGSTSIFRTPSRTVRSNWLHYLRASWQRISRTSKVILGTTLLTGLTQVVITIAILIIGKNEVCDKPLDAYLIVFLIRLGFSLPLMLYQYLRPSGPDGRSNQSISTTTSQEVVTTPITVSSSIVNLADQDRGSIITSPPPSTRSATNTPEDIPSINDHASTSREFTSSVDQVNSTPGNTQHPSYRPTIIRACWLDRFKSLLDLTSILWFVVGNYMLFTASYQCHRDAKYLFYTTMAWILLGYLLVLIPLLLCVAAVFCLPCLLVAMRVMNVDYATGMVGASKNEIQAIPVYKYKSPSGDHHSQTSLSSSSSSSSFSPPSPSTCSSIDKKKRSIMSYLISYHNRHRDRDDEESSLEDWTMDTTDASCTICLSDYENGDFICKLRCDHHFHRDCVHEWLLLNYKCPLCQRDFRLKKSSIRLYVN